MNFGLKGVQLSLVSSVLILETVGLILWLVQPSVLLPFPVDQPQLLNFGFCRAIGKEFVFNVTLQVNPWTHFFSGTVARMINRFVYRITSINCRTHKKSYPKREGNVMLFFFWDNNFLGATIN